MRAPAYSLWDAVYYVECTPKRRAARGSVDWAGWQCGAAWSRFRSPRTWRRRFRRRPLGTAAALVLFLIPVASVALLAWSWIDSRSLATWFAWAGLASPSQIIGKTLAIMGLAGLFATVFSIVPRPWVMVGRTLRPSRRWRLWGYQAGAARRGPADFLEVLGKEQAARVAFWRERLRRPPGLRSEFVFFRIDPVAQQLSACVLLLFMAIFWGPALFGVAPDWVNSWRPGPLSCAFPLLVWSPLITAVVRRRLIIRRLTRTLEHLRCPDCGYDLLEIPGALPKEEVPGAGPARCPECGSMWPLVPPPVDIDDE